MRHCYEIGNFYQRDEDWLGQRKSIVAIDSTSPVTGPKFKQPKQSGLTFSPVRPNFTYSIAQCYLVRLLRMVPYSLESAGNGLGLGLTRVCGRAHKSQV